MDDDRSTHPFDPAPRTGLHDGALFVDASLRGARFERVDLSGAVMRGVELAGADLDAPFLLDGASSLLVNGVDVAPFVEAELERRMPGRAGRRAHDVEGLRRAWAEVEHAWLAAMDRAQRLPSGAIVRSIDGEWSFADTNRHLVMATDTWLRYGILGIAAPFHPIGLPDASYQHGGGDMTPFSEPEPTWERIREVRLERMAMVAGVLDGLDDAELDAVRVNPWDDDVAETVRSCLHTILEEEWEHLRFALRDLDAVAAMQDRSG